MYVQAAYSVDGIFRPHQMERFADRVGGTRVTLCSRQGAFTGLIRDSDLECCTPYQVPGVMGGDVAAETLACH